MPILETIRSYVAAATRPTSKPEGFFVVRPGYDAYAILAEAEKWKGSTVIFYPGEYVLDKTFEFYNIAAILGFGPQSTRFLRYANTIFQSVWRYANIDAAPVIGGFQIRNMIAGASPAIELGGSQNLRVEDIYSWGAPGDLICLTNADAELNPPPGRPVGTWTENAHLRRLVIYGPKTDGIATRNLSPTRSWPSFSWLHIQAQITLTEPNSIACNFRDHSLVYAGSIDLKVNADPASGGTATCFNLEPETQLLANHYNCYVEGDCRRLRMASSARLTGHGRFYRQNTTGIYDDLTPGTNYLGQPAGTPEIGIFSDQ